jgi:Spy/CpxP family protein refolding chaperone
MKRSFRHTLALIFAILWIGTATPTALAGGQEETGAGHGTAADIKRALNDTARAIRDFTMAQKKELMATAHSSLKALDRKIKAFETDSKKSCDRMNRAAREKAKRALNRLKKQRAEAGTWLDRLQKSSSRTWKRMKKGLSHSWKALEKAFNNAEKTPPRRFAPHPGPIQSC